MPLHNEPDSQMMHKHRWLWFTFTFFPKSFKKDVNGMKKGQRIARAQIGGNKTKLDPGCKCQLGKFTAWRRDDSDQDLPWLTMSRALHGDLWGWAEPGWGWVGP